MHTPNLQPNTDGRHADIPSSPSAATSKKDPVLIRMKRLAIEHTSEIVWALLFAVLAGYAFALYIEEPPPYKIYVVTDLDTDSETLSKDLRSQEQKKEIAHIGRVPVKVQVVLLAAQDSQTAKREADELAERADTLLVIQHGRSEHVAHSLPTYMGARPQIPVISTVATDDSLLAECGDSCFDRGWFQSPRVDDAPFIPLLQLSPTNAVQGRSAVQFASQRYKRRRFLVVTSSNPEDRLYAKNMTRAYTDAIKEAHAELVGVRRMNALPSEEEFKTLKADCILYAGGVGEAQALFDRLMAMHLDGADPVVMLSDSVVESRGTDSDLAAFGAPAVAIPATGQPANKGIVVNAANHEHLQPGTKPGIPVNFTYQGDAEDYNSHCNTYAEDAFLISERLIDDLNQRGGDLRFQIKSFFHLHNVKDARRSLADVMRQNSLFRSSYASAVAGRSYVFDGYKQSGGIFHVWQLRSSEEPGSKMDDIDNWHPPRTPTEQISTSVH